MRNIEQQGETGVLGYCENLCYCLAREVKQITVENSDYTH